MELTKEIPQDFYLFIYYITGHVFFQPTVARMGKGTH